MYRFYYIPTIFLAFVLILLCIDLFLDLYLQLLDISGSFILATENVISVNYVICYSCPKYIQLSNVHSNNIHFEIVIVTKMC